jgi:hypothetical protein
MQKSRDDQFPPSRAAPVLLAGTLSVCVYSISHTIGAAGYGGDSSLVPYFGNHQMLPCCSWS